MPPRRFPPLLTIIFAFFGLSLQPPSYHAVSVRLSVFAISKHFDRGCFDALGVNDNRPLASLNPRAERVSYSPVIHQIEPCAKLEYTQAPAGRIGRQAAHPRRGAADCGEYCETAGVAAKSD